MRSLVYAVAMISIVALTTNASEPPVKHQFGFDSSGPELMAKNKDIVVPWVSYTLVRASCNESHGGESTFRCEFIARDMLIDSWANAKKKNSAAADTYLDSLATVREAGFLSEYVWVYLMQPSGKESPPANVDSFKAWAATHLVGHTVETHILAEYK